MHFTLRIEGDSTIYTHKIHAHIKCIHKFLTLSIHEPFVYTCISRARMHTVIYNQIRRSTVRIV